MDSEFKTGADAAHLYTQVNDCKVAMEKGYDASPHEKKRLAEAWLKAVTELQEYRATLPPPQKLKRQPPVVENGERKNRARELKEEITAEIVVQEKRKRGRPRKNA